MVKFIVQLALIAEVIVIVLGCGTGIVIVSY